MAARALTRSGDISPGYFTWLASDGWGKQSAVVNEIQEFAVGAITVELESKKIHGRSRQSVGWSASETQSKNQKKRYGWTFFPDVRLVICFCLKLFPASQSWLRFSLRSSTTHDVQGLASPGEPGLG